MSAVRKALYRVLRALIIVPKLSDHSSIMEGVSLEAIDRSI